MSHPTRVIDIRRNLHGLPRVTHKPVCNFCGWRGTETADRVAAQRAARIHGVLEVGA